MKSQGEAGGGTTGSRHNSPSSGGHLRGCTAGSSRRPQPQPSDETPLPWALSGPREPGLSTRSPEAEPQPGTPPPGQTSPTEGGEVWTGGREGMVMGAPPSRDLLLLQQTLFSPRKLVMQSLQRKTTFWTRPLQGAEQSGWNPQTPRIRPGRPKLVVIGWQPRTQAQCLGILRHTISYYPGKQRKRSSGQVSGLSCAHGGPR